MLAMAGDREGSKEDRNEGEWEGQGHGVMVKGTWRNEGMGKEGIGIGLL